jgi:hypothetical protein
MPALTSAENRVPLKLVLVGVRDVALIHYPSFTDSIKPSLKFSRYFVVINASEGSLCFQSFIKDKKYIFVLYTANCECNSKYEQGTCIQIINSLNDNINESFCKIEL